MRLNQLTRADVAIGLGALTLLVALAWPTLRDRRYTAILEEAVMEVDLLRAAVIDARGTTSTWPARAPVGEVPAELSAAYRGRPGFALDGFALEWSTLKVIEYVVAPPAPSFVIPGDDEEVDTSIPPSGAIGDLPPDSVGPETAPSVRRVGAIVLHSGNESLLADLLDRYGSGVSYVRDTTWTLIVDDRSSPAP